MVVCGPPASGKTTLARLLGDALTLAVLNRDDMKTELADQRGERSWTDPAEHAQMAQDAFRIFHERALGPLQEGHGIVLEAAYFWPLARHELQPLREIADLTVVECQAPSGMLRDRYADRWQRGERHACHRDGQYVDRMDAGTFDWTAYDLPADLDAPVVTVDTTDGYSPPVDEIVRLVSGAGGAGGDGFGDEGVERG